MHHHAAAQGNAKRIWTQMIMNNSNNNLQPDAVAYGAMRINKFGQVKSGDDKHAGAVISNRTAAAAHEQQQQH